MSYCNETRAKLLSEPQHLADRHDGSSFSSTPVDKFTTPNVAEPFTEWTLGMLWTYGKKGGVYGSGGLSSFTDSSLDGRISYEALDLLKSVQAENGPNYQTRWKSLVGVRHSGDSAYI